jgi:hypothetical protein
VNCLRHPCSRRFLDSDNWSIVPAESGWVWLDRINEIYFPGVAALDQIDSRVNGETGTDYHENIRFLTDASCRPIVVDCFAKENDVWAQLTSLRPCITQTDVTRAVVQRCIVENTPAFHNLTVQMQHVSRPGTLVQIIHILCHDSDLMVGSFQIRDGFVSLVRGGSTYGTPSLVVKGEDLLGRFFPGTCRADIFCPAALPEAVSIAERLKATFLRYSGTGEKHNSQFTTLCTLTPETTTLLKIIILCRSDRGPSR